jgi:hypothetical protein
MDQSIVRYYISVRKAGQTATSKSSHKNSYLLTSGLLIHAVEPFRTASKLVVEKQ